MLTACITTSQADSSAEDAVLNQARAAEYDTNRIAGLEPQALAKTTRVTRDGDALQLTLTSGDPVVLRNRSGDCVEGQRGCVRYLLAADLPTRHAVLIYKALYEGGDWLLLDDRNGHISELDAVPYFAPDDTHFLVIAQDEGYGDFYGLEMWRRDGKGDLLEWTYSLGGDEAAQRGIANCHDVTFAKDAVWRDGNHVALDIWSPAKAFRPDCGEAHWPAVIECDPTGWRLNTQWPRG